MKVQILEKKIRGSAGYDVVVNDASATIADYMDALNIFIENGSIHRLRGDEGQSAGCMGCNNCCQERIPITSIDVNRLSQKIALPELFQKYIYIYVSGRSVDMTLKLGEGGVCRLNNPANRLCSNYSFRPLVCQTYICCTASSRAKALREAVVNMGEDQLVRDWICWVQEGILEPNIDEADDFDVDEDDWGATAFAGKTGYDQVLLQDVCSAELWEELRSNNQ